MEDDNPRPAQRPRIEGPATERVPLNIERDRAVGQMIREVSGQTRGTPSGEACYDNSHNRGGGGEFRSFHTEANAHIASREPDGENTRRLGANGRDVTVQNSGQSTREGLDHPGQPGRAPASMTHTDMSRSSLDIRRRDERGRNPVEMD
jgi:hypothetical protein